MIFFKRNNWLVTKLAVTFAILTPVLMVMFEVIFTDANSVTIQLDLPNWAAILLIIFYLIIFVIIAIWFLYQIKSLLTLKNEKKKNELLHLKSQVSPHFFFNTLNNLYGTIDQDKEKAKQLVLKLSELMRYSIYEGEKDEVSLKEEIAYLSNYIELQQLRYHKQVDIQFKTDINDHNYDLMPLLFIILMENAFKHGVENMTDGAFVYIDLTAINDAIIFEIENNFDAEEISETSGIGLKNLKRRLNLVYPNNHKLTFSNQNSNYKVKLELQV